MTFSLRGDDSIPTGGSGRVLITDINPNGDNNEDALICRSEIDGFTTNGGDWFLHPTEMSTDDDDRINPDNGNPDRGWLRNRGLDSGHLLVRLRRDSATAEEGVFTCHITGDINTPRSVGVYYPSEFILILIYSFTCGVYYNYTPSGDDDNNNYAYFHNPFILNKMLRYNTYYIIHLHNRNCVYYVHEC